ncbi:MAG: hypothetical protein LBI69_04250, partial [Puniceicoccales bacterium]|nr:hypothetical protein [Puniceicoccales bacterium]
MAPYSMLAEIFRAVFVFCDKNLKKSKLKKGRPPSLSIAYFLTLLIFWQRSGVKDFKTFYHGPM